MGNRQAQPQDELFLLKSSTNTADSPIIEPLRISKRATSTSSVTDQQQNTPLRIQHLPYPDDRPATQPALDSTAQASPSQSMASTVSAGPGSSRPTEYASTLRPRDGREPPVATIAERRGNVRKTLPESPGPEIPDKEELYATDNQRCGPVDVPTVAAASATNGVQTDTHPHANYHQQYWPPPPAPSSSVTGQSQLMNTGGLNRVSSTASTSTTRAQRGSPPPPETPIVGPHELSSDIEARYAAAGIAGTSTLAILQTQSVASQRRAEHYVGQPPRVQGQGQRPWTPTEQPGSQPHGPPTIYQGPGVAGADNQTPGRQSAQVAGPISQVNATQQPERMPQNAMAQDLERIRISASPPPAYSSVPGVSASQRHPIEKQQPASPHQGPVVDHPATTALVSSVSSAEMAVPATLAPSTVSTQDHPAFANDPRHQHPAQSPSQGFQNGQYVQQRIQTSPSPAPSSLPPASPPPLPEGWIAHLDPNSGQYYYIHLPTQSTQWEFPKGPTPLNLNEAPLSPVGSVYSSHPLASPGLSAFCKPLASPSVPLTPGYESLQSPLPGFSGPPPSSGVDLYKVVPTNGVYFGPYLRYTNMDLERGIWLGSILLVTDAPQPPTIHIHQSVDLSPNPRQLKAVSISLHQRWTFYKYDIDLVMEESGPAKWTYAVTSHLGCTRYEFLVAGRYETNWRFIATSGNDFSLNANANERARLGGVGFMWKDIVQKHNDIGGFHAQLCLGGQIYADRMWKELPSLRQWLTMRGKETRKNAPWTAAHEEDVSHAYFHYYTSHFDQPYLRESFAQIPYICQIDDHDIFDGFGSYPEHMQFSNMFKNVGRIGLEMYLLFQHHTTLNILRQATTDIDVFTITGTGWHFVKYLGPAVVVVGPDCRSERNPHQVMAGPTYQGLFPKVAMLPPSVQHCIWMISVPLIYPRLDTAEQLANTVATGKRAVTGAYNVLGKVTSSVAGVVGAKEIVGSGFDSLKRAVGKSGLMGGILNPFGELDLLDELRDLWTHESKDLERTYLIRTLQGIAHQKSLRMTFISGAVNTCGAGLVHDPTRPSDYKTMYQIISSPVVNTPAHSYIVKLLHSSSKPLFIPANGHRSSHQPTDTKEDMMEIFQQDVTGQPREYRKVMARRNYVAIVAYDPETVTAPFGHPAQGRGKMSLAIDFMVQGDGTFGNVVKYGPVIVPSLERGR